MLYALLLTVSTGINAQKLPEIVQYALAIHGGAGGFIAINRQVNIIMLFNTPGMFRGYFQTGGEKEIAIFAPEFDFTE